MELAPQVEDLTKTVQSLPSLIDSLWTLLETPTGSFVLIAFFLWLFVNKGFSPVFEAFGRKEKQRLEQLNTYVSSLDSADPRTIEAIQDLRTAYYFKIATGVYAENKLRNALIKAHDTTSHLITWRQIRRALPYIEVDSTETITIRKLTFFENITYWYNKSIAYASLLASAVLITLWVLSDNKMLSSSLLIFGEGIMAVLFAIFFFSENWPAEASKKIDAELEKRRQQSRDA